VSDVFQFWKTAHILSAAILFGTGFGIAFFCWFGYRSALRSGEIGALRAVLRLTVIADACFTAPAVVFQALSGLVLMHLLGWPLASAWSVAVWCLYVLVGVCWLPVVAIQVQLKREAERASSMGALPAQFHRRFRWWFALGIPAFTALVVIFYLMVAKPLAVTGT
jgi:uncharacterized membrane protein